ncbi:MAG: hypothetical protein RIE73_36865 [Coleofasciculus sp. C1-SOL-03]|uniref:hypothetical protein n=1 Tax=Coleofasciculus sp. C1-SOL-03 TaxID=3069522 RepID=UPI0032FD69CE
MANGRPTGVTILAVLSIIGGILYILAGLGATVLGGFVSNVEGEAQAEVVGAGVVIFGVIIALILGVLYLVVAYGLFTLKQWAWSFTIVFQITSIINALYGRFAEGNIVGSIISIIIAGVILYYLNQTSVKRAFGRA